MKTETKQINIESLIKKFIEEYYNEYIDFESKKQYEKKINELIHKVEKNNSFDAEDELIGCLDEYYKKVLPVEIPPLYESDYLIESFSQYVETYFSKLDNNFNNPAEVLEKFIKCYGCFSSLIKKYEKEWVKNSHYNEPEFDIKALEKLNADIPYSYIKPITYLSAFAEGKNTKDDDEIEKSKSELQLYMDMYKSGVSFEVYEIMNYFGLKSYFFTEEEDDNFSMVSVCNNIIDPVIYNYKYRIQPDSEDEFLEIIMQGKTPADIRKYMQYLSLTMSPLYHYDLLNESGLQTTLGEILFDLSKSIDLKKPEIYSDALNTLIPVLKNISNDDIYFEEHDVLDLNEVKLAIETLKKKYFLKSNNDSNYVDEDNIMPIIENDSLGSGKTGK